MIRNWWAPPVAAATVLSGVLAAPAAPAAADDEALPDDVGCHYSLSAPQLVQRANGDRAVRATLSPTTCNRPATQTDVIVCLKSESGYNRCNKLPGWQTVEVVIPAVPAGGVFTATGKGCWQYILDSFTPGCRAVGPIEARV